MELQMNEKDTVVSQISIGGFGYDVSAKDLMDFLENKIGVVYRCRLKTSWTPLESYPNFEDVIDPALIEETDDTKKVEPHAFVHFALPSSATRAFAAAADNKLIMNGQPLKVTLGPENPFRMNQRRRTTTPIKLSDVILEIGTLVSQDEFFVSWRGPMRGVDFLVDPFDNACRFCFTMNAAFSFKGMQKLAMINCNFKMDFLVRNINEIKHYTDRSHLVVMFQLTSSPLVWYRTADDDIVESVPFDLLDDDDPWIRTTDFTRTGAIGRCNFYRVLIPPRYGAKLKEAMKYLQGRRVRETRLGSPLRNVEEPDFGNPMSNPFFCFHYMKDVPFEVLFLVNVAVHKGIINQHQVSDKFAGLLRGKPKDVNIAALKHISSYKRPVFDACKRLKLVQEWLLKEPKLLKSPKQLNDLAEVRRLVITPTRAYCMPPEVEISNRVLRKYKDVVDRFLRVTFMDEGMESMNTNVLTYYAAPIVKELTSNSFPQKTKIFNRVRSILSNGLYLCGRKYSFLAFSPNQLRDQSAWFFAENGAINVTKIHDWMGEFSIRNVAKCAARMGLCFSSTYATVEVPSEVVNFKFPDIKRNDYVFSDGIGTMTPDLALEVAQKLKLEMEPPSAYQIRYAGCKGVIASWPSKGDNSFRLSLRPSMQKFKSSHTTLEICSWTRFQPGFLNRQIITLLSTLKVTDDVFWRMQETMIFRLNQMFTDADVAFNVLTESCAEQGNVGAIMLSAGFSPQSEPHLRGMLTCIRAAQLWGLREKARIFIPSGRWLMGCLDELGVLEQGQCFIQVSVPHLENSFRKHGSRFTETKTNLKVISGYVVIAKNPCLHPGDVRILQAIDSPDLHHLRDCLVFPQEGDRPHPDEASGSDLDGDLYFVTWDENLIPPGKKSWTPMVYNPAEAKQTRRDVTIKEIIEFFSKNLVNENLGTICNAHVVHADLSEEGALDNKCLKLAELAATAVDFPKTGVFVTMPPHLKPKLYPDFMSKEEYQSYKSTKILGRLYRKIKDAFDEETSPDSELNFGPDSVPYDNDLEVPGSSDFIADAWELKHSYDSQLHGLMLQYKVKREEEIVTGQVWSMPKYNSRKQGDLTERLKKSYAGLRKEFREVFETLGLESDELSDDEKSVLYEKKASAWYQVAYHPEWVKKTEDMKDSWSAEEEKIGARSSVVLLSFAWIAADYLARIKIRLRGLADVDHSKPINSLAKYLADRI